MDPGKTESKVFRLTEEGLELKNYLPQNAIAKACYDWIEDKVEIKSVAKSNFLHGKMYYIEKDGSEDAILGSSNFTVRGLGLNEKASNIELNLEVDSKGDCEDLKQWFDNLWESDQVHDVKKAVKRYLKNIYTNKDPEFIYFKTLYHIFEEFLNTATDADFAQENPKFQRSEIWKKLYEFQKHGVQACIKKLKAYNGCIIADSVGLGKTFEALAIIKYFEIQGANVLVLCPKKLEHNWTLYSLNYQRKNNPLRKDNFHYTVRAHSDLTDRGPSDYDWGNFDLVVIDESHNFRNRPTDKYEEGLLIRRSRYNKLLEETIKNGCQTQVLMLSATPVNNKLTDLENQIRLITEDNDNAFQSTGINSVRETLRNAQNRFEKWTEQNGDLSNQAQGQDSLAESLNADFFNLLDRLTIARSREHIIKFYHDTDDAKIKFPEREKPIPVYPDIDTDGIFPSFQNISTQIDRYKLSLFNPSFYIKPDCLHHYDDRVLKHRENNLIGMMKVNFLKRLESSVHSFDSTLQRTIKKINELVTDIQDFLHDESELKILDPAVGSGAFPMGMLQKLTLALRRLDPKNKRWKKLQKKIARNRAAKAFNTQNQQERDNEPKEISRTFERYRDSDFGRKLYLIQNTIFGIDIQPIACQIAKLRFFISLAIEQKQDREAENFGIQPLPNLETRFVATNTLIGFKAQRPFTTKKVVKMEQDLRTNREKHFHATTRSQKLTCKRRDKKLRAELAAELKNLGMFAGDVEKIAKWDLYDQNKKADWFDPEWMFGITEGFDIVIGNPPYSKSENVPDDKSEQLTAYYGYGDDLYGYFIFAGFKLVSEQGIFTYIANDSFVTFSTKRRIRDLFLENQLMHLVKAPANTFEATIYTAIFILLKTEVETQHSYMSGEMNFPDFKYIENGLVKYTTVYKIPDCKLLLSAKNDWVLRLFSFENVGKYCLVLDTGIDSGNVRSKIFFEENNGSRHRLLQGKQIQRYSIQWDSPKAKYKFCDVNYERLPIPGIGRGGKPSKKKEYWKFRGDIENHHQPERLLIRQTDDDLIVAYQSEAELGRFYTDNTLHTILPKSQKTNLKYFLALFNSRLMNYIYHSISQEKGKSQAQVKVKVVRELPVVVPSEDEQRPIIALVDEILEAKTTDPFADTAKKEEKIDKLVYALYDLTDDEIAIVEGSV